ncbi:MAG: hypothetical protein KJ725_01270 [Gammaproteobacteria bacterium]|nr:hypothetical protein [Gammaproteobacteria bacterium]
MDGFTQHLNSIVHWLWLTILGNLGAGFTAFLDRHTPHPNDHEDHAIVPANERSLVVEGAVTRPAGRREYIRVGSTAAVPAADACRSSNRPLSGTGIVLSIEKLDKECRSANFHSNVHEDLAIVPANERSRRGEGAVTRPTGRREYVHVGSTAAFPAADACQSSNRPLSGTGIVLSIEKLDKECKSANFHSNVHEGLAIAPANESSLVAEGAVTRPAGRREYIRVGSAAAPCRRRLSVEQPPPLRNRHILCQAFYIKKLDKESKSANFHSKIGETAQTGNCCGQEVLHVD